jgi:hypothetical protein
MKEIKENPTPLFLMEKDDSHNITGLQLKVWALKNNTVILLRLYNPDQVSVQAFFDKHRHDQQKNNKEIYDLLLSFIIDPFRRKSEVPRRMANWESGIRDNSANSLSAFDEFEDKDKCFYVSWQIKESIIGSLW